MKSLVTAILPCILVLSSCTGDRDPGPETIAVFDGGTISKAEFVSYLRYAPHPTIKEDSGIQQEQGLEQLLKSYAIQRILAAEAEDVPEPDNTNSLILDRKAQALVDYYKNQEGKRSHEVTEGEVVARYEELKDSRFELPRRIKFQHILIRSDKHSASEVSNLVSTVFRELDDGRAFSELVDMYSDSETVKRHGVVGPVFEGGLETGFETELFRRTPESGAFVIDTRHGLHIVEILMLEENRTLPIDEVRAGIISEILSDHAIQEREALMSELKSKFEVTIHGDLARSSPEEVIATVGSRTLTRTELETLPGAGRTLDLGALEERLDWIVSLNLLYLDALQQGLDQESAFLEQWRFQETARRATQAHAARFKAWGDALPDEEIERFFNEKRSGFAFPKTYEVSTIVVPFGHGDPFKAQELAEETAREWRQTDELGSASMQTFLDTRDLRFTELGTIDGTTAGMIAPELQAALFEMDSSEVSAPIKTRYGLLVVKTAEIRPKRPMLWPDDADAIRARALILQRRQFQEDLPEQVLAAASLKIVTFNLESDFQDAQR